MVERAADGEDPEVNLTVVEPKKVPAAVGGGAEDEAGDGDAPEEQPTPPPAADAEQ
jgi:hypothetical protein